MSTTSYSAVRITHDSRHDFDDTRARFEGRVPGYDNTVSVELVLGGADWPKVEAAVAERLGPDGLVSLARLDQGTLLSLDGNPLEATLYLVGNPLVARQITRHNPAGVLYAPFSVAIYHDDTGVHISYNQPSSVLGSLDSNDIVGIGAELDTKIHAAALAACD